MKQKVHLMWLMNTKLNNYIRVLCWKKSYDRLKELKVIQLVPSFNE